MVKAVISYAYGTAAFVHALSQTACLEPAQMEHRRWCYDRVAHGWEYNEKRDDHGLRHDCILTWDALTEKRPDTCKYDLMPLIAELETTEKEGVRFLAIEAEPIGDLEQFADNVDDMIRADADTEVDEKNKQMITLHRLLTVFGNNNARVRVRYKHDPSRAKGLDYYDEIL